MRYLKPLVALAALIGFLSFTENVLAQNSVTITDEGQGPAIGWGLKAGVNLSKISGTEPAGTSKKWEPGFRGGVFGEYPAGQPLSIRLGAQFDMKGMKLSGVNGGTATEKLDYVTIPLTAKATLASAGASIAPYAFAGGSVGFLTSAKVTQPNAIGGSSTVDVKSSTNSTNWGLLFGAGLEKPFSRMTGLLEAAYDLGLSDIAKNRPTGDTTKNRTQTFYIAAGVRI
jgi:hypothetical protein